MSYSHHIEEIRQKEYPDEVYLDHAGCALFAKSVIHRSSEALLSSAYGNPHSKSPASQRSTEVVEKARLKVLKLFNADPAEYSVVFTANATAAIKLVGEGLDSSFQYTYLNDSHTSLVGLRKLAGSFRMVDPNEMLSEIQGSNKGVDQTKTKTLISWPSQSNFSGKRYASFTDAWIKKAANKKGVYTLIDAAGEASTHPPDLSAASKGPDFLVISLYKIFGYPDLGALIVKKTSGMEYFRSRQYFGGGTVESLTAGHDFAPKHTNISTQLEDGTLPFHSILALSCAIDVHYELFDSFNDISKHSNSVAGYLYGRMEGLQHSNGVKLCRIYSDGLYNDPRQQGPIVTFNLVNEHSEWIGYADFDKLISEYGINIRTGTLCNSAATSQWVGISENSIMENHSKGHVCGDDNDVMDGVPTGAIRASFGAYSSKADVDKLINFLKEYYIDQVAPVTPVSPSSQKVSSLESSRTELLQYVSSITLFPIKSCGGFRIPKNMPWKVTTKGLQWDREFCLVNMSDNSVMSLKKHPRMALIHPEIVNNSHMRITSSAGGNSGSMSADIVVPLYEHEDSSHPVRTTTICGDNVQLELYKSSTIVSFFSDIIGVQCTLARFPANDNGHGRFYKPHLNGPMGSSASTTTSNCTVAAVEKKDEEIPLAMSNSSPLLLISQKSAKQLAKDNDSEIDPAVFRANIEVAGPSLEPFAEDMWTSIQIGENKFRILGPCRRCNMVGVDAKTGKHNNKPYLALHKNRKMGGQLFFGQHMTVDSESGAAGHPQQMYITVGDALRQYR